MIKVYENDQLEFSVMADQDLHVEQTQQLKLLVALTKLGNRRVLEELRHEVDGDPSYAKILEMCKQETTYGQLVKTLVDSKLAAERTAARKISELADRGVITQVKRGVYVLSGLLD